MSGGGGGKEDDGLPSSGLRGDSVAQTLGATGVSQNTSHPLPLRKGESRDRGRGGGHLALPSHSLSSDSAGIPQDSPPLPFPNTKGTPREGVREGRRPCLSLAPPLSVAANTSVPSQVAHRAGGRLSPTSKVLRRLN